MDKQDELFKWIDENTGSGIVRGKLYFNSFYCDPYILKNKIKELAKEPQKVKVPAYVAEWYEAHKDFLELSLGQLGSVIRTKTIQGEILSEFKEWFNNTRNKPFETIICMKDGYEVEEEIKYRLVLPHVSKMVYGHATKIHNMKTKETKDLAYDTFTEQEIKSIDERYWPFAVPVEKV